MIFIWAYEYFIRIKNQFKNTYSFHLIQESEHHSHCHWISREIPRSQLLYLKVTDLDQYSLYGCWYNQVNDRFSRI